METTTIIFIICLFVALIVGYLFFYFKDKDSIAKMNPAEKEENKELLPLRLQAYELRDRRKRKAQEAAQRAPVWMVIPLALCFMPAMAAVVVASSLAKIRKASRSQRP